MHGMLFSLSITPTHKEITVPRAQRSKYFWPASAITEQDMALVYAARETSLPRIPISELIARAVRTVYATEQSHVLTLPAASAIQDTERKAAA